MPARRPANDTQLWGWGAGGVRVVDYQMFELAKGSDPPRKKFQTRTNEGTLTLPGAFPSTKIQRSALMVDRMMRIYRLVPDAIETDPNWDLAELVGEVVVRAFSPADARIVAAEAEVDFLDVPAKPGDGVSTSFASAFRDNKLYRVVEDDTSAFPRQGPRAVLSGLVMRDTIKHGNKIKTRQ